MSEVRRMVALVVDDLGLYADSMVRVRDALRRFVGHDMRSGDLVAIVRSSAGMGSLQQFTTDPAILDAAIDRIRFTIGRVGVSSFQPVTAQTPEEQKAADAEAALDDFRGGIFMAGTLGALRFVIDGLHEMPGRKAVILFSENLPVLDAGLRGLTDAANRASVVIDTIDPRGLQTFMDVRDYGPPASAGPGALSIQLQRELAMESSQEGLAALARAADFTVVP